MSSVIDGFRQAQCLAVAVPAVSCSRSGGRQRRNSSRQNGYGSGPRAGAAPRFWKWGGVILRAERAKKFFWPPPLFGQWRGDKILLSQPNSFVWFAADWHWCWHWLTLIFCCYLCVFNVNFVLIQNISASFRELFPNYVPPSPFASKSGGHDPPAPMGAPPLSSGRCMCPRRW